MAVLERVPAFGKAAVMQPFRIEFSRDRIKDLHRRIDAMLWPEMPFDTGWSAGPSDRVLKDLVRYWRTKYDWFAVQEALNRQTHLRGPIGGENLHCVLYRATGQKQRFPILMMHGWPDCFTQFEDAAPRLARGVGGQAGFDVVCPSYPGWILSDAPRAPGMNIARIAERMHLLMRELGYNRYAVHGEAWGSYVGSEMALRYPEAVVALHLNWAPTAPAERPAAATARPVQATQNPIDERRGDVYHVMHRTTPNSIHYALQDSPVGALAFILWKYWSYIGQSRNDDIWAGVDRDHVLTVAMLHWLPGRLLSACRIYWENPSVPDTWVVPKRVMVPTGYARFGGSPPRAAVDALYNVVHYSEPPGGGHLGTHEEPAWFSEDVATFLSSVYSTLPA